MSYDVARLRGLHPALGDGWIRFDAPAGMVIPESVATTVSTAFRSATANIASPHPSAQRSTAVLVAARRAIADLVNGDPDAVVLGADRAGQARHAARCARRALGQPLALAGLDLHAAAVERPAGAGLDAAPVRAARTGVAEVDGGRRRQA